ncbi:hypothetical protein D6454_23165, partial [Salmonella enterica subsp. enterica serovar Infantis]|nr:hypothetical protein [Salmonella enterica subsp. enterica serovar Infantis]
MPVVWHCGFNGIVNNTMNIGQGNLYIGNTNTETQSIPRGQDQLINNVFGRGGSASNNNGVLPLIQYYGRKWTSNAAYGTSYIFGRVKPSFFDNSVPCLSTELNQPATTSDWWGGWE